MSLTLDSRLLEVLACPCPEHGKLLVGTPQDSEAEFLTCTSCDRRFPVQDGIPVLLLDEAIPGPGTPPPASSPEVSTSR
ncbi:Trm112 family protein [Actinoalloteichus hymeniacidonis]|uniref:Uncharacterized protein n=1 Tax=Actinoalloteichus hymeniacidonis TaxID=340345 RepID=A0AAC9HVW2_9PSEU|nr:Trm112 family protein [Actinoalloteichus hymeniacidonis]AOS65450.1 hypothetical protein TL08_23350 [Actinoalloteichus hymeniacidonis]MBB5906463.1 hypothetical protein [Actinoalloteichus hymeniacidonis]